MEKNENPTIKEFDYKTIANFFQGLERQGPGSDECTLKAINYIPIFRSEVKMADLGCGTGHQTSILAKNTVGRIYALDLLPEMMEGLNRRISEGGFEKQTIPIQGAMDDLPFNYDSFDVIWAEGSIYNIGFEKGLRYWRDFLRTGGYVAVTECCWISNNRPSDDKWIKDNLVEIDSIDSKVSIIKECGYRPVANFILPEDCWRENYYDHMKARIQSFIEENGSSHSTLSFVEMLKTEMDYYETYHDYYGYVFFIAQKI